MLIIIMAAIQYRWAIFISIQLFWIYCIYDDFFVSEIAEGLHGQVNLAKCGDVMYSSYWLDHLCEFLGFVLFINFFLVLILILANKIWSFCKEEEVTN